MSNLLAKLINYRPAWLGVEESGLRRFVTRSRHAVGWLLIEILLATAIMLPFNQTASANSSSTWTKAAPITDTDADTSPYAWHNWAADPSHWTTYPAIGAQASPVSVPTDNFQLIGNGSFTPGSTGGTNVSTEMISGDKWITLGQETVGTAGISNQQISSAMRSFPKNSAYIFAQYSPENATGRIVIQKVEKMPNGVVNVYQADFTPWSGELWRAQGKYRTDTEIADGAPGYNPFANFEGASTDPLFHNVSWEAMKVAVGHAMRRYGVAFAFIAWDNPNITTNVSTSSGWFTNKVTTTLTGYAQPIWWVATPMEATATGETGQSCVVGGAGAPTTSCPDPAYIATAGAMFSKWTGGNMPQNLDQMYSYTGSQTNWNVLFFVVIISLVTFGVASFLDPVLLAAAGGTGAITGAVGGSYALASTVFGSGGSLLQTQQGFFGATGNGWVLPQTYDMTTTGGQVQSATAAAVNANHVLTPMGSTLNGVPGMSGTHTLYSGNCGAGLTVAQCQGLGQDPGTIWRPDSYAEYNSTKAMRQRYDTCVNVLNYTGTQAEQCAAPAAYVIQ